MAPARRAAARLKNLNRIPLVWFSASNWGDALNPHLVRLLAGKSAWHAHSRDCDHFMAIGSILGKACSRTVVWGSGFIREGDKVEEPPKAILAVRGPLTRNALLRDGIECPELYGDPALLLPLFFNPDVAKRFEVGLIPHYVDKSHPWIQKHLGTPGVLVIDVEGDTWDFVRAVKSCKTIISSSLHGLICADAYGVPNTWVRLSDQIVGGDFKFKDYLLSIGAGLQEPLVVSPDTALEFVTQSALLRDLRIDTSRLLLSCPFLSRENRLRFESMSCLPNG